ncbi:metallophosphoesterase [Pedobacter nutrimenti]|nr:metallophosphoesterase [Pedobacter nutrimenti]
MKHIFIPDLHGRNSWQDIDFKQYNKVVFLGDYVDSFTEEDEAIYNNLVAVIKLKRKYWKKVILLLGNHDVQYLHFPRYQIKGFRPSMQRQLTELFNQNKDCFQMAYQRGNYIFTHAGISNSWYREFLRSPIINDIRDDNDTTADLINKVEAEGSPQQRYMLYSEGIHRGEPGDLGLGSPIWADRKETMLDMLTGYRQVVGHTQVLEPEAIRYTCNSITYIDVLHTMTYFHEMDI